MPGLNAYAAELLRVLLKPEAHEAKRSVAGFWGLLAPASAG